MSDGGLTILDGTNLKTVDLSLPEFNILITGAQVLDIAESRASLSLLCVSLPENLKSSALKRLDFDGDAVSFRLSEFDRERASSLLRDYLSAISDELQDDPLVISNLDGSTIRLYLEDEDDFAMLAENLFTDLDTEDKGKIKKSEIRNALIHMGVDMGIPSFSEYPQLNDILKKHGAEGEEELGQSQFAELLQTILQELADALAGNHIVVIQNIKIINGSKLKKVLADEKHLNKLVERMLQENTTANEAKKSTKLIRDFLEENGKELGMPVPKVNDVVVLLYDAVFADVHNEKTATEMKNDDFVLLVKEILVKFVEQLEASPVFHEVDCQ